MFCGTFWGQMRSVGLLMCLNSEVNVITYVVMFLSLSFMVLSLINRLAALSSTDGTNSSSCCCWLQQCWDCESFACWEGRRTGWAWSQEYGMSCILKKCAMVARIDCRMLKNFAISLIFRIFFCSMGRLHYTWPQRMAVMKPLSYFFLMVLS